MNAMYWPALGKGGTDFSNETLLVEQIGEACLLGGIHAKANARSSTNESFHPLLVKGSDQWLKKLINNGTFDMWPLDAAGRPRYHEVLDRIRTLTRCIENASFTKIIDPEMNVLHLAVDAGFRDVIAGAARRMAESVNDHRDEGTMPLACISAVSMMMTTVCALHLNEELAMLAAQCPEAMSHPVYIGKKDRMPWASMEKKKTTHFFTPYYAAMQISNGDAIDAMRLAGLPGNALMACKDNEYGLSGDKLDALGVLTNFNPYCSAEILRKVFAFYREAPILPDMADQKKEKEVALTRMLVGTLNQVTTYHGERRQTFIESGAFDADIPDTLMGACIAGLPDMVSTFAGKVDWLSLQGKHSLHQIIKTAILKSSFSFNAVQIENACIAFWGLAQEHHPSPAWMRSDHDPKTGIDHAPTGAIVAIQAILDHGFDRLLVAYMKAGFDPMKRYDGLPSAAKMASESTTPHAERMRGVIHAFCARQKAMDVLRQMDDSSGDFLPFAKQKPGKP